MISLNHVTISQLQCDFAIFEPQSADSLCMRRSVYKKVLKGDRKTSSVEVGNEKCAHL